MSRPITSLDSRISNLAFWCRSWDEETTGLLSVVMRDALGRFDETPIDYAGMVHGIRQTIRSMGISTSNLTYFLDRSQAIERANVILD